MALVKFGNIVNDVKVNVDRNNNPYEYYIAGDHMTSEDLTLRRKGKFSTDDVGPAFIRIFKPGQVLYGSRRTYLKKVAVADFEGVTANTTFVLESKNEEILSQRLLPFIMLTDGFTNWSIKKSKGSTNPYILFSDLAEYEFDLPPIEEQERLAKLLWAAYELKESYKKLIVSTDEMVKAQFIDMFGNPIFNDKEWNYLSITSVSDIILGSTPNSTNLEYWDGDIKWITPAELNENSFIVNDTERHITEEGFNSAALKFFPKRTVIFTTRAPIGKVAIAGDKMCSNQGIKSFICHKELNPVYLFAIFKLFTDYFIAMGTGSTFKELSKSAIEKVSISVPPINIQNDFEFFYTQSYKSKAELQQSIENIDKVMRSLLP